MTPLALLADGATQPTTQAAAETIVDLYRRAQFPLLAGMLALAGAAWAGLNFIWKMKESIYDKDEYERRVAGLRDIEPELKVMTGFDQLRALDLAVIVGALTSAVLQISLGFVYAAWSSVVCFLSAVVVVLTMFYVVSLIRRTSQIASHLSEDAAEKRINKIRSERVHV